MISGSQGPNLVIANGASNSNTIVIPNRPVIIRIHAPAALDGTVKPYSSNDSSATFQVYRSGGSDIEIPAGSVVTIKFLTGDIFRLQSSVNQTAARTFTTRFIEEL